MHNAERHTCQDLMGLWNIESGIYRTLNIIGLKLLCLTSATCRYEEYFVVVFADILISFVGSPFVCKVLDASQVLISGSALKMSPLGRTAVIMVDPQMSAGDLGSCDVTVTSPSGQTIPVRLTKTDKFTAEFMPAEVGEF